MDQEILVRGATTRWMILARLIGPVLIIVGVVLLKEPIGIPLCAAGVCFAICVEIYAMIKRFRRRWVRDTGNGFVVNDSTGMREILDHQVVAVSLNHKQHHSEGILKAKTRYFRVWIDADPVPIDMTNRIPTGGDDPLGAMIGRVLESLRERCDATLAQGGQVGGDGWTLSNAHLTVGSTSSSQMLPIDQITAIDEFENKVSVWVEGRDDAMAKFPVSSRNAYMLLMLVAARIKETDDSSKIADPFAEGDLLGRILFQRRSSWLVAVVLLPLGFVVTLLGLAVLISGPWYGGLAVLAIGGLLCMLALHLMRSSLRCHELGVCKTGLFGEKRLKYVDVESFSYNATRHFYNGVYTGTKLTMNFKALPGTNVKSLAYNTSVRNVDDDLDNLRDHISQVIAVRMGDDLSRNGFVSWTANLTFRQEGIQYTPGGLFGRKEPQLLSWEEYHGYDIQQGTFHLFSQTQPKSVMQENCSQPNFYPGFYLLVSMLSEDEESTT